MTISLPAPEASPFLPFAKPDLGEEEIEEVVDALRSGWLTTGPKTRQFETEFAAFLGGGPLQALAVNSATAGLHLALEAIGVGPGDEVITTTLTFTATAEVVRYLGADPVFVDVDPDTLCIDIGQVASKISPKTRAIIPVHFGGLSCDMPALLDLARAHRIRVVEDAAHALPSSFGGRMVGTFQSDATVFSFYANKTLATGEGGMIVTSDAAIASRCKVMRLHGISRDAFDRFTSRKPAWQYEVIAPGFKYNLTDVASAIGIHQLRRVRAMSERRRGIAQRYSDAFARLPCKLPPTPRRGDTHSWHLYVLQLRDNAPLERGAFIEQMAERGIGCSVHYIPLHRHPYWRDTYGLRASAFPVAEKVYHRAVSLPIYSSMSDDDVERVIFEVSTLLRHRSK
jgi:dTDP-4-amino-4,6-dideoxygalactose transaminase